MNHYLTARLRSQSGTRNAEIVVAADAAGAAADREIQRAVGRIIEYSATAHPWMVTAALTNLSRVIQQITISKLTNLALWSHKRAARDTVRTLTTPYRVLLAQRSNLREAVELVEEDPTGFRFRFEDEPLFSDAPIIPDPSTDLNAYLDLIFPPPSADRVRKFLEPLVPPMPITAKGNQGAMATEIMAQTIARVRSEGGNNRQVAKALMPFFDNSRTRAMRVARTYGLFVANEMHLEISNGMGSIVAGRQVNNPGGENARPDHALRSGTVYWKNPTGGQYGYDVMPRPPWDTGRGPHENGGGIKWGCRCWMNEVLTPLGSISNSPTFHDAKGNLVPDQLTYADWWATATEKQRRAAVGSRRYDVVLAQSDNPQWIDFVSPKGSLLSVEALKTESTQKRADRKERLRQVLRRNAKQRADVLQFGFVA